MDQILNFYIEYKNERKGIRKIYSKKESYFFLKDSKKILKITIACIG